MATPSALGPYTLIRRVGVGGMGEVWIARREAIGGAAKLVALKTVLPEKAGNAEFRRMFLDEARLAMLMNNSNIVQTFDVDETPDGLCYMAMEYVEGVDLAKLTEALRIRGELLSHSVIAYIVGEVLKALAYAHDHTIEGTRRTVVHRDISPQNVMLSNTGEVKVTDFGIARLASEETSGSFVRGKFRYMPPEQFERGIRAPTLDLFAVGAILHELLEGKRFRGGEIEEAELIGMCVRGMVPPGQASIVGLHSPSSARSSSAQPSIPTGTQPFSKWGMVPGGQLSGSGRQTPSSPMCSAARGVIVGAPDRA